MPTRDLFVVANLLVYEVTIREIPTQQTESLCNFFDVGPTHTFIHNNRMPSIFSVLNELSRITFQIPRFSTIRAFPDIRIMLQQDVFLNIFTHIKVNRL